NYYIEGDPTVPQDDLKDRIMETLRNEVTSDWQPSGLAIMGAEGPSFSSLFKVLDSAARGGEPTGPPSNQPVTQAGKPAAEPRDPVELRTMSEWLEKFDTFTADLDLFLQILGATGVLIAVFGVVNTMLMSVSERIIEFGILKANGWSRGDVLRLICSESLILGIAGGLLGASVGWVATEVLNAAFPDRLNLYAGPGLLTFAVGFSSVVGTLGGLYPALWAMRMQPMDAIRRG
ncbi:MAG: ABC transporter permease, partial [Planctomycetota bacterium]